MSPVWWFRTSFPGFRQAQAPPATATRLPSATGLPAPVLGYVGGTPFDNTNLLASIAIAYQGTAVKTYYLTYSNTTTATSRYLLTEVEECAGTGTTNCLAPTTVSWQAAVAGVGSGTALGGTVGSVITTAYDLNGDGRNDLVMNSSTGTMLVAFGGSSGYGTPVATGFSSTGAVGDIDGSGVDGLLVDVSGTWDYYKWNGSAFVGTSTGISVATAASPVLADLDGDGRADFVYTDSTGIVHVRLMYQHRRARSGSIRHQFRRRHIKFQHRRSIWWLEPGTTFLGRCSSGPVRYGEDLRAVRR